MASIVIATVATLAATVASSLVAGTIMSAIVYAGVMAGVTAIGYAIFGPNAADAVSAVSRTPEDIQRTIQSSTESRKIVYGTSKVGGPLILAYSSGSQNQYLHLVEALCEGPVKSIEEIWFNDTLSTDSRWQAAGGGHRTVSYTGETDQLADANLVSECPEWTDDHRLRGTAYIYTRLHYQPFDPDGDADQALGSDVWCNGIPTITAVVKGRKVYDPRDSTQEKNNPDTWTWSRNPVLCILDYIRAGSADIDWPTNENGVKIPPFRGLEAPDAEIDWANWETGANICDESITFSDGTTGVRYTLDGVIYLDAQPSAIIEQMLTTCVGNIVYAQGLWRIFPAAYKTSDFSLTSDDLRDSIKVLPYKSKSELFNTVKGTYASSEANYVSTEFPTVSDVGPVDGDETYEEIDGGVVETSISLPFTSDYRMAQRLAKLALRKQRICKEVTFPAKLTALPISAQSVIDLTIDTLGWAEKPFRVVNWALADYGIDLTLQEESTDIYAYTSAEEVASTSTNAVTVPDPWYVEPPTNLAFSEENYALSGNALLTWTVSTDAFVAGYKIQVKGSAETTWSELVSRIQANRYSLTNLGVGDYSFRIQAINTIGATSSWVSVDGSISIPLVMERVSGLELWQGEGLGNKTEFTGQDAKFVWRAASKTHSYDFGEEPFGGDSGALDTYFKDYEVRVVDVDSGLTVRTEHPTTNYWEYSYEKNFEDGLRREFKVEVYQRGDQNQLSSSAASLTVSNPAPDALTGLKIDASYGTIYIQFTSPDDNDFKGILIWLSQTSGFTPSTDNQVFDGIGNAVSISGLNQGETYYLRIAGYDGFGKENLNTSSEVGVDTLKNDVDKEYVDAQDAFVKAQADSAAQTYANDLNNLEQIRADAYADGIVTTAEARAIAAAQTKADAAQVAAEATAISYTDTLSTANLLVNADFSGDVQVGWSFTQGSETQTITPFKDLDGWFPTGGHCLCLMTGNADTNSEHFCEMSSDMVPVVVGEKYGISCYTGAHRCRIAVFMYYYDSTGAYAGNSGLAFNSTLAGGHSLSNYIRIFATGTIPSGANQVRAILRKYSTTPGEANSYGFFAYPMLQRVTASQTIPSAWCSGTGLSQQWAYTGTTEFDGGNIRADTVTAVAVGTNEIITNTANIANGVIVSAHIGELQVTQAKIADAAIDEAKIADLAVTNAKIDDLDGAKIHADSTITIGDVAAGNYCMLTDGEVKTFRYLENLARQTKELKQWEAGSCDNADANDANSAWTYLTGYYETQPSLFLTPKTLQTVYDRTAIGNQFLNMDVSVIELVPDHTNQYRFKANARLIDDGGVGNVIVSQTTTNTSATATYSSSTITTPALVVGIAVHATFSSSHGTGTDGLYYIRKFQWRLYIDDVAQTWSAWYELNSLSTMSLDSSVTSLTSKAHTFKVETSFADYGGTFNTGTVTEYSTSTASVNETFMTDYVSTTNLIDKSFSFTVPTKTLSGWTLSSIKLTGSLTISVNNTSDWGITVTNIRMYIDSTFIGYDSYEGSADPVTKTMSINNLSLSAGTHTAHFKYRCSESPSILRHTASMSGTYTYTFSRLKPGTTAVENKTVVVSYDYTLGAINVLSTGSVNYLALGV